MLAAQVHELAEIVVRRLRELQRPRVRELFGIHDHSINRHGRRASRFIERESIFAVLIGHTVGAGNVLVIAQRHDFGSGVLPRQCGDTQIGRDTWRTQRSGEQFHQHRVIAKSSLRIGVGCHGRLLAHLIDERIELRVMDRREMGFQSLVVSVPLRPHLFEFIRRCGITGRLPRTF